MRNVYGEETNNDERQKMSPATILKSNLSKLESALGKLHRLAFASANSPIAAV